MPPDVALTLQQFAANGDFVQRYFADLPEERLRQRPPDGKWGALQNFAHVGQYHDAILERVGWILTQDNPHFPRYAPDQNPETQIWVKKSLTQLLTDFPEPRARLLAELRALPQGAWARPGTHTTFGTMTLSELLAFLLMHDSHHIYVAAVRART